jgi:hypothetical protein
MDKTGNAALIGFASLNRERRRARAELSEAPRSRRSRSCANRRFQNLGVTVLAGVLGLLAFGCGDEFLAAAPVGECLEVATQCRLAKGPLGVCERRNCEAEESPPCFSCTPQH